MSYLSSLARFAEATPDREIFRFHRDAESYSSYTYAELYVHVQKTGEQLKGAVDKGQVAAIILPPDLVYVHTLLGCWYAGLVALPLPYPTERSLDDYFRSISLIIEDAGVSLIITDELGTELEKRIAAAGGHRRAKVWDVSRARTEGQSAVWSPRPVQDTDLTLLLYTSGSVSRPKGVMLSERNLLSQSRVGRKLWGFEPDSVVLSWMSRIHNFGLHFSVLTPLLCGVRGIHLTANLFRENPASWLRLIGEYRATHTSAANFAFDYCCAGVADLTGIDLKSLRCVIVGGEPNREQTYLEFFSRFAAVGLRREALCPSYGMSEVGTITSNIGQPVVAFEHLDRAELKNHRVVAVQGDGAKSVASCGAVTSDATVVCVRPGTSELAGPEEAGEVWIHGDSVALGYFNSDEEAARAFDNELPQYPGLKFLRTGDLGFFRGRELFLVGRAKEMLILNGKNYYPFDLEWCLKNKVPELRLPAVVFGTERGNEECLTAVQEVATGLPRAVYESWIRQIVKGVTESVGLNIREICLVAQGSIPKAQSGKVQRSQCKNLALAGKLDLVAHYVDRKIVWHCADSHDRPTQPRSARTLQKLKDVLTDCLSLDRGSLDRYERFSELGLGSLDYVKIARAIADAFAVGVTPALLFKHAEFSQFLDSLKGAEERKRPPPEPESPAPRTASDVAIIGMACHFPGGASDAERFWRNLVEQKDGVVRIADVRPRLRDAFDENRVANASLRVEWAGLIEDVDTFDHGFFGVTAEEAAYMDPQHRKALETTWRAIEDAGYRPSALAGRRVGVFAAAPSSDYLTEMLKAGVAIDPLMESGNHSAMLPNRVSHVFDFRGPSEVVNSACASSIVALHNAVESIKSGDCEAAVVVGVNVAVSPQPFVFASASGMLAKDGRCRTFDSSADGVVRGEGWGALLLKPLAAAKADGDPIYGVVKGACLNHNGRTDSLKTPSPSAQESLLVEAYRRSQVDPRTVRYIETHGGSTLLGDSIEVEALKAAFQTLTGDAEASEPYCALGCTKTQIGNLEAASGIAAVIRVLLSFRHGTIPGLAHFTELNPYVQLERSPFHVAATAEPWPAAVDRDGNALPRRAGVSSYGFGGVNGHVILEECVDGATRPAVESAGPYLIVLSAKRESELVEQARQLARFLDDARGVEAELSDIAHTLQVGREAMDERLGLVVHSKDELKAKLADFLEDQRPRDGFHRGTIELYKKILGRLAIDEEIQDLVRKWMSKGEHETLLDLWAKGLDIEWAGLLGATKPRRISLPTYPFAKERHWLLGQDAKESVQSAGATADRERPVARLPEVLATTQDRRSAERSLDPAARLRRPQAELGSFVRRIVAEQLKVEPGLVALDRSFFDLGLTSHGLLKLAHEIRSRISEDFAPKAFFERPNLAALIGYLSDSYPEQVARFAAIGGPAAASRVDAKPAATDSGSDSAARAASPGVPVIVPDLEARYEPFPLNDIQESFFTGRKIGSGTAVGCHVYLELEFAELDIYRLNQAWKRLVDHHEMLRALVLPDGRQRILEQPPPYEFKVADLRRKDEQARSKYLAELRAKMSCQVYGAGQWPLFEIRASVCKDKTVVHVSIDEYVVDAFSFHMLMQQWRKLYEDPNALLPKSRLSFRDYVLAAKRFESSERYEKELGYWLAKLEDMPPGPLQLSREVARADGGRRARFEGRLSAPEWEQLKKRAQRIDVSPTVVPLCVFGEVVRAWNGGKAFSLISTFFNRLISPELQNVVGPFMSTNILVAREWEQKGLEGLLRRTQASLYDDLAHSNVSGVRVLRELKSRKKIPASLTLPIVFTSLLGNQQGDVDGSLLEHLAFSTTQTPQVAIDHQLYERAGELRFSWDVAESRFRDGEAAALFAAYCDALRAASAGFDEWSVNVGRLGANSGGEQSTEFALTTHADRRYRPFALTDQQLAYAFGKSAYGSRVSSQIYSYYDADHLDVPRLERAWHKVMQSHEMLVARFRANGTQQIMEKVPRYAIKVVDLRGQSEAAVGRELKRIEAAMVGKFYALEEWPSFDVLVSRVDDVKSRIHLCIDLIVADGPSMQNIAKSLFYFYENDSEPARKNAITFSDYVHSHESYRSTQAYARHLRYWVEKFAHTPSGPRLPMLTGVAGHETKAIHGTLRDWSVIEEKAKSLAVLPGMVLLTAYAEVLAEWSDSKSFSIVIPSWERLKVHSDVDGLVGDFTSMSWLVVERTNESFEKKVVGNHAAVQEDLSHQAVSGLTALRERWRTRRNEELQFPVVFTNLSSSPRFPLPKGFELGKTSSRTSQVHIDDISTEVNGSLQFQWDVVTSLFPEGLIDEMFAGYERLLKHLVSDPNAWKKKSFASLIDARPQKYRVGEAEGDPDGLVVEATDGTYA